MNIPRSIFIAVLAVAAFTLNGSRFLYSQGISGYTVLQKNDLFRKSIMRSIAESADFASFPVVDCSVEYLRRNRGKEIVYRRGPVALDQFAPMRNLDMRYASASQPAAEFDYSGSTTFVGGMIVDLPRAGETAGLVAAASGEFSYMMRIAMVPKAYEHGLLTAEIFIERAIVDVYGDTLNVRSSEVFSKYIQVRGNTPLNFSLPRWEADGGLNALSYVPENLEEDVLVMLETPHNLGFSQNFPNPFTSKTRISYAVPVEARIKLTINVQGTEVLVDEGVKQPGIHHLVWNADDEEDGTYTATLNVDNMLGEHLGTQQLLLSKESGSNDFHERPFTMQANALGSNFRISSESSVGYQFPVDSKYKMRYMFTHVAVRLGYQFNPYLEIGALIGQEAFNEHPSDDVDTEAINDFGSTIGRTYPYGGGYLRYFADIVGIHSVTQVSLGFTRSAPLVDFGIGFRSEFIPQLELFVLPSVTLHLKNSASTKLGFQYGLRARF